MKSIKEKRKKHAFSVVDESPPGFDVPNKLVLVKESAPIFQAKF